MNATNMVIAFGGGKLFSCKEIDTNFHCNFSSSEVSTSTSVVVNSSAAANLVMLGAGYFCPLTGFHNKDDALSICEGMRMKNGHFWPIPILNLLPTDQGISVGDVVAL